MAPVIPLARPLEIIFIESFNISELVILEMLVDAELNAEPIAAPDAPVIQPIMLALRTCSASTLPLFSAYDAIDPAPYTTAVTKPVTTAFTAKDEPYA